MDSDRKRFELLRKEYNFYQNFLYKQYISNMESIIKYNSSAFWNFIHCKRDNNSIPKRMFYGDLSSNNIQESCELFADYFQTTFIKPTFDLFFVPNNNSDNNHYFDISLDDLMNAINSLIMILNSQLATFHPYCLKNVLHILLLRF